MDLTTDEKAKVVYGVIRDGILSDDAEEELIRGMFRDQDEANLAAAGLTQRRRLSMSGRRFRAIVIGLWSAE